VTAEDLALNDIRRIELALMPSDPRTFFPRYLHSVDDVAAHRSHVRSTPYSEYAVEYLLDLVWGRVNESRRRNLVHGLNAVKSILRNRNADLRPIPDTTVDRLFEVYQHFVFDRLDEIRWSVSAILKGKLLRTGQLEWLLTHYEESEHIVNRLLRYPAYYPTVAEWAREALGRADLVERTSELLGRLIVDTLPPEAASMPAPAVLWAIYYSSAEIETKSRLIREVASPDAVGDLIDICTRLDLPDVLLNVRDRIQQIVGAEPGG
jgi:hypothetical protein